MIIYDPVRGEYIDEETGEVIEERAVDMRGGEIIDGKRKTRRHGEIVKLAISDFGVTTWIERGEPKNRRLNVSKKRLRTVHAKIRRGDNRRLVKALEILHNLVGMLNNKYNIPKHVVEHAGMLIRKIIYNTPQILYKPTVAVALYISMRKFGIKVREKDVREPLEVTHGAFRSVYRHVHFLITEILKEEEIISINRRDVSEESIIEDKINEMRNNIERVFRETYNECVYENTMKMFNAVVELLRTSPDIRKDLYNDKAVASALIRLSAKKCFGFDPKTKMYSTDPRGFTAVDLSKILGTTEVSIRRYERNLKKILNGFSL